MALIVIEQKIPEVLLIKPEVYGDIRGFFMESFNGKALKKYGINNNFVQDNHSRSSINVVRGLHFQEKFPQGKLVRVSRGKVFDVAVDVRPNSFTYGQHVSNILSEENFHQMYIPPGFAHGFLTLDKENIVLYSCTNYRNKESETTIAWDDKDLKIKWPIKKPILSPKDSNSKSFKEFNLKK